MIVKKLSFRLLLLSMERRNICHSIEEHPIAPVNPYGQSKVMVENILRDWAHDGRSAIALRYFNPVGAHVSGRIGEDPHGIPNNLMPNIAKSLSASERHFKYLAMIMGRAMARVSAIIFT